MTVGSGHSRCSGRWRLGAVAATLAAVFAFAPAASAQAPKPGAAEAWPQRTVRLILPFGAGSGTDISARLLAEKLSPRWGHPVVVENRPGADALLAVNAFLAAKDDHVLLYGSSASFMAHPYVHDKLPYVLDRDLAPIARVTETIGAVSTTAKAKPKTLKEFVAWARAEPGKISTAGAAGVPEFTLRYFIATEKLDVAVVPYRDVVQAGTDLGAGHIQLLVSSAAVVHPHVEAGRVRMLAVTIRERTAYAPDTPTVYEAGFPALSMATTVGLYGPSGMPIELRKRIGADVVEAASDKKIVERLLGTGQVVNAGGPEAMAQTLKEQAERIATIAKRLSMERKVKP